MAHFEEYNAVINKLKENADFAVAYDDMRKLTIQLLNHVDTLKLHMRSDSRQLVEFELQTKQDALTIGALQAQLRNSG